MSINMTDYRLIKDLEAQAARLGFSIGPDRYSGERMALYPNDAGELPCYSRDATLWSGTAENLLIFLRGWEARITYDRMLGFTQKKIERAEQNLRNDSLLKTLKEEKTDNAKQ